MNTLVKTKSLLSLLAILLLVFSFVLTTATSPAHAQFSDFDKNAIDTDVEWLPSSEDAFCGVISDSNDNINFNSSNNVETAYKFFRIKGFTPEQASAIVGNLMSESSPNIDPLSLNASSGAYGIAQWLGGRKDMLFSYADKLNLDVESLQTQLFFIWFELVGEPEIEGLSGATENRTFRELKLVNTVDEAVEVWADYYERSGDKDYTKRKNFANSVYESYGSSLVTGDISNPVGCFSSGAETVLDLIEGDTTEIPCRGDIHSEYLADGYREGKRYRIRVCVLYLADGVTKGPHVNSQISGIISSLFKTAQAQGTSLSGGGFRTMSAQIDARIRNCSDIDSATDPDLHSRDANCDPPTARPGYSNHQMGVAIDFRCDNNSAPGEGSLLNSSSDCFRWLSLNAERFGLYNLPSEPWHWSIDGK